MHHSIVSKAFSKSTLDMLTRKNIFVVGIGHTDETVYLANSGQYFSQAGILSLANNQVFLAKQVYTESTYNTEFIFTKSIIKFQYPQFSWLHAILPYDGKDWKLSIQD